MVIFISNYGYLKYTSNINIYINNQIKYFSTY